MNVRSGKNARRTRQEGALARLEAQIERGGKFLDYKGPANFSDVEKVKADATVLRAKLGQYTREV